MGNIRFPNPNCGVGKACPVLCRRSYYVSIARLSEFARTQLSYPLHSTTPLGHRAFSTPLCPFIWTCQLFGFRERLGTSQLPLHVVLRAVLTFPQAGSPVRRLASNSHGPSVYSHASHSGCSWLHSRASGWHCDSYFRWETCVSSDSLVLQQSFLDHYYIDIFWDEDNFASGQDELATMDG